MRIQRNIKNRVINIATDFEVYMQEKGFTIGDLRRAPLRRFYRNGIYPVYVGYQATEEEESEETDYIHCGSGDSLGLRCPVMEVDFLYFNEKEMKRMLNKEGEGILVGLGECGQIDLGSSTLGIKTVREAYTLFKEVEKWMKQNGKKVSLELLTDFLQPHLLKKF